MSRVTKAHIKVQQHFNERELRHSSSSRNRLSLEEPSLSFTKLLEALRRPMKERNDFDSRPWCVSGLNEIGTNRCWDKKVS